jgi:hypothetical protein
MYKLTTERETIALKAVVLPMLMRPRRAMKPVLQTMELRGRVDVVLIWETVSLC